MNELRREKEAATKLQQDMQLLAKAILEIQDLENRRLSVGITIDFKCRDELKRMLETNSICIQGQTYPFTPKRKEG